MTPAFVGFIVVALVGGAAEMASAFSGARKNRLDLSVGIALGSASQIALFVAPVLVLLSYVIGPAPMDLQFWPGAVVMMLIATLTASLVTNSGRSAWFVGVLVLMVYLIFAMTLYLLPPRESSEKMPSARHLRPPASGLKEGLNRLRLRLRAILPSFVILPKTRTRGRKVGNSEICRGIRDRSEAMRIDRHALQVHCHSSGSHAAMAAAGRRDGTLSVGSVI